MATIADVARLAGVSMMTVSRVINNSPRVSEKTRKNVQQAIEQLSYRPNMVAKGLATRHNHMVAYVMSNLANPFFGNVSKGVENCCVEHGYTVIICDVASYERLEDCFSMLIDRRLDGVIFHHLDIRQEQLAQLRKNGVRCVTIDNECDLEGASEVNSDNYLGARLAVRHLVESGHRSIGCIHGHMEDTPCGDFEAAEFIETFQRRIWRERTQGFLDELAASGLQPACLVEGRGTVCAGFDSGRGAFRQIFESGEMPGAIYCENDLLALGVLSECLEKQVSVPERLAIVGHDGLDFGIYLYPRVTTVRQPQYEIGYLAAEKLIDLIDGSGETARMMTHSTLFRGDTA